MPNVTPPSDLQTIIGQAEPYGVFQQFLDMDGSWKWVRGPSGTTDLTWSPDGTITITSVGSGPQTAVVDLDSSQLATLSSNPPVFVPAPGSGKALAFLAAYGLNVPGTVPFSGQYTNFSWEGDNNYLNDQNIYLSNGLDLYWSQTDLNSSSWTPDAGLENKAIVAYSQASDDPSGAILDTSLDEGGTGYVASDTFLIATGNFNATGVIDTASPIGVGGTTPMIGADRVAPSFTVTGDQTTNFAPASSFTVSGASTPPAAIDTIDSNDSTSLVGTLTLVPGVAPGDLAFLDNGSSYISIPTAVNLQTDVFSVVAWIKRTGNGTIMSTRATGDTSGWEFGVFPTTLGIMIQPGTHTVNGITPISTGVYHHVAATYDGTDINLYLDGILEGTTPSLAVPVASTEPLLIGQRGFPGSFVFNGVIAQPAVYDVGLSPTDIATLAAGGSISTAPVSQWTFAKSNNGNYTTNTSVFGGVNTVVTTNESVLNPNADGDLSVPVTGGVVSAYHLTNNGYGYVPMTGTSTSATSGTGTGLTLNIDSITPANGSARVWITYQVLELPA